ncbi:hypothetical protein PIROE2DRAFT_10206 [Piromyces sp. E2]|nr:hypothetical protein PIROE2DRAFT_10206 [Piromyces sp. E2]|eukprot:OUM63304.1 hypothetical protein PIROE2DRAFT_10206 [Piromyces sp. E2]
MKFWKRASLLGSLILMTTQKCYGEDFFRIGMRALVLSTEIPETILMSLASYGIPYDNLIYNCENPLEGDLYLYDENTGDPKYNMIILATGSMKCKCYGSVVSALKDEHWKALRHYEAKYNIRRVTFNESSEDAKDIGCQPDIYDHVKTSSLPIIASDNKITSKIFENAGIHKKAPLNTLG